MGRNSLIIMIAVFMMNAVVSCEIPDNDPDKHKVEEDSTSVGLEEVAQIGAGIPLTDRAAALRVDG